MGLAELSFWKPPANNDFSEYFNWAFTCFKSLQLRIQLDSVFRTQNHFFGSFGFAAPAFSHLPSAIIRAFAISNYFPFLLRIRNRIQCTVIRSDKEEKSNTFVRVLLVCASWLRVKSVPIQRHFFFRLGHRKLVS